MATATEARPAAARIELDEAPLIEIPGDADFDDMEFLEAPGLRVVGELLRQDNDFLLPAREFSVDYLWKRKGGNTRNKLTLGKCATVSGLTAYYCQTDFVIWLAADHCRPLLPYQVRAALFHELCHITSDDKPRAPTLRLEDVRLFAAEIAAFGLWSPELAAIREAFVQATLPFDA